MMEDLNIADLETVRVIVGNMERDLGLLNGDLARIRKVYPPVADFYSPKIDEIRSSLRSEALQIQNLINYKESHS